MTDVQPSLVQDEPVDLTNCDREPIHLLGGVQAYGCLIAITADFMISHVSENIQLLLGIAPEAAVGTRLNQFFPEKTVHDLRVKLHMLSAETPSSQLFGYDVLGDGALFDVSVHASGQAFVFEFEPNGDTQDHDEMSLVRNLVARIRRTKDLESLCDQAAMAVQVMTGFDRVMVYKFADDGSGQVIAEKRRSQIKAFMGLCFPASDIPQQARALYLRSTLRLIADVDGAVSPILPSSNARGEPIDLSLSVIRAVSPIHLEYLRNMGVNASMSVSIIKDGKLWGLFACHHEKPRYVSFARRTSIELFAQFFSYDLMQKIDVEARVRSDDARQMHDRLMIQLSDGTTLIDGFEAIAAELTGLITNDGVAVFFEGKYASLGEAPDELEFKKLLPFLNTNLSGQVFATHSLAEVYPEAKDFSADVAGVLAIPISRTPRDYIVFFRREVAKSITWAGNPTKAIEAGRSDARLTPRKSFESWLEMVQNTSHKWTDSEMQNAEFLRISLIEIVLKLTEETNETRRKAANTQELLIAELNHRVRNILNLIQSLVSQSRDETRDVTSYTKVLDGRLQALARAHDQLTQREWAPSSLRQLIEVEARAFLTKAKDRLTITGDVPMLKPNAFSTVALVIHEMVTNAVKYGALMDECGKVFIDLRILDDGALQIKWREKGGAPVQAPTWQGFGTTIIEQAIPHELRGTVETRYAITGFEADIIIPAVSISAMQDIVEDVPPTTKQDDSPQQTGLRDDVLLVEDNMVIALDTSDILTEHGASYVHMTGNVEGALKIIADHDISFALLDVNLGDQNSLPVAEVLADRGIPFILATGYGDAQSITANFPPTEIVNKPFTAEALKNAIDECLTGDT